MATKAADGSFTSTVTNCWWESSYITARPVHAKTAARFAPPAALQHVPCHGNRQSPTHMEKHTKTDAQTQQRPKIADHRMQTAILVKRRTKSTSRLSSSSDYVTCVKVREGRLYM